MRFSMERDEMRDCFRLVVELTGTEYKDIPYHDREARTALVHLREFSRGAIPLPASETLQMLAVLARAVEEGRLYAR